MSKPSESWLDHGEVAEWTKAVDSKSIVHLVYRGFESRPLRHPALRRARSQPCWPRTREVGRPKKVIR